MSVRSLTTGLLYRKSGNHQPPCTEAALHLATRSLLIVASLASVGTHAAEHGSAVDEINELAHEFAECSAYFMLISEAPRIRTESPALSRKYKEHSALMLVYSSTLTSKEVAQARQELAIQTMTRMMKRDWSKISIVMNKYLYPCKDLAENPTESVDHLLDQENN